jgi:aminopeptidase N
VKLNQALSGLLEGLKDSEARVRRAVVDALAQSKTDNSYTALKAIAETGDASYYTESAALSGLGAIAAIQSNGATQETEVLELYRAVLQKRAGWNEVVRSGAIAGLSKLKTSEAALNLILEYTIAGVPQPLRLAAIRAIGAISTGQTNVNLERILGRLTELSRESFFLTQVSTVMALGQMETLRAAGILQGLADQSPDGRVRRLAEEAIQRVQQAAKQDQAVKKMQEELEQLKKDNQELRSRLESLEAKAN